MMMRSWKLAGLAGLLILVALLAACGTAATGEPLPTDTAQAAAGLQPAASPSPMDPAPTEAAPAAAASPTAEDTASPPATVAEATPSPAATTPVATAESGDGDVEEDQTLAGALRRGGYVVYFRHMATDNAQSDQPGSGEWWTSCDPQRMRQLSPEGQAQARAIGEAMRTLDIPAGRVLASPYCRTVQSAELLDLGPVEATTDVMNMLAADEVGGREQVTARARQLLATAPQTGTNTVIVAHGNVIAAAADLSLAEGEAAILRPEGGTAFSLVDRVLPDEWDALVQESAATAGGAAEAQAIPETCEPTPPDQLGPFYEPGAPQRSSVGRGYVLSGVVRSADGCAPIPGAQIEFWLAGPDGAYRDDYRATLPADPSGAYRFESHAPPPYSGRPPHIHVRVTADGHETLVTQHYPVAGQAEATFDLVLVPQPGAAPAATQAPAAEPVIVEFPVPAGSHPHDVAPAPDGTVWYTAQASGELGRLDPATGETHHVPLGPGSAPHGVIVGPDGAAWVTDSGQNAIVRVDAGSEQVQVFPLPAGSSNANLNTAAFDGNGVLWFTGQSGVYGRLDPESGQVEVWDAPRGRGPYGIGATPDGQVYYVSLAGNHLARVDLDTGEATVIEPPTAGQGARRVWSDSRGRLWVSEWNAGQLGMYDPAADTWQEWALPGDRPQPYAVYVDDQDMVWLSDFGANALVRFDPVREEFEVFALPSSPANVRQILGRPGEVWGAESGADKLVVIRTR